MNSQIRRIATALTIVLLLGFMTAAVSAETAVRQSSDSNVDQSASVSGGDARVEQESSVRTETNDALVEQHAEMEATKEEGEPAQVERDVDRRVVNPENDSISYDIDQRVVDGNNSLQTSQRVFQAVQDAGNTTVAETGETIESTRAEADTLNGQDSGATAETDTDASASPLRQGGSFTLFMQAATTIGDVLADIFTP